ncbi:MAG: hypothetical protein JO270_18950 [Acidobacteriaceae bacterium]|nr:hypothetical protein [Acidobacteriaceae bacterium]MBV8592000.1 hypothetical protein [Acetobacteraceae bacterium]
MAETSEARKPTAEQGETGQFETRDRRPGASAEQIGQNVRDIGKKGAEATARTGQGAAELVRQAADQNQCLVQAGWRTMAEAQAPIADVIFQQSQRIMENAARATDVYREASERTSDDVRALVDSFTVLTRGLQNWYRAYLDLTQRSIARVSDKCHDSSRVSSPVDVAEMQRALYVEGVQFLYTSSTTLLQLGGGILQEAVRPLQERSRATSVAR